jgi:hypothetical protein
MLLCAEYLRHRNGLMRGTYAIEIPWYHGSLHEPFFPRCTRSRRSLKSFSAPDTTDLAFRVGLHSGSSNGGVLRDNARFQLFGDSMNTTRGLRALAPRNRVHSPSKPPTLLYCRWQDALDQTLGRKDYVKVLASLRPFGWYSLSAADGASVAGETDSIPSVGNL